MACWERVEGVIFPYISVSGSKGQLDSQLPVHLGERPAVMRHILESRNRVYEMQRTSTEICQRHSQATAKHLGVARPLIVTYHKVKHACDQRLGECRSV